MSMAGKLQRVAAMLAGCGLLAACGGHSSGAGNAAQGPPALHFEDHLAAGGNVPSRELLHNPHAGDPAVARAGEQLFHSMNCDGCHAPDASGAMGPSLIDGRWRYGGSETELFTTLYYGRPKGMPAFGGVLGADGVWALVTWLRSVKPTPDSATEAWSD